MANMRGHNVADVRSGTVEPDGAMSTGCMVADEFNARIIKQTVASVAIDWNLILNADVYKIEKYSKSHGGEWQKVAWTSQSPAIINNLEENFAYRFRIKALKYLLDKKEYLEFKTSAELVGSTITSPPSTISLHRAIRQGQQFLIKRLLRRRPSLIEYPGPNGYMPLANAITHGNICIIDILLTAGANIHVGNTWNRKTPLHLAFEHGHLAVARLLLNRKVDMEAVDANNMTACHFAVDGNQFEMLRFALENGANVEATDACGWTLLLRAVMMRADLAILKLLVMHGANTKVLDKQNQSAADLARLFDNEEASNYLIKLFEKKNKK